MVTHIQVWAGQDEAMDVEKSGQGIVVNKLTGKVAKVSNSVLSYWDKPLPKRKGLDAKPVCPCKKSFVI